LFSLQIGRRPASRHPNGIRPAKACRPRPCRAGNNDATWRRTCWQGNNRPAKPLGTIGSAASSSGQQTAKAKQALDQAFVPHRMRPRIVLFWLPVTKSWLQATTLGLALTCHSSERGIVQFFQDHCRPSAFDGQPCIHAAGAVPAARLPECGRRSEKRGSGCPRTKSFKRGQPVLVAADVASRPTASR